MKYIDIFFIYHVFHLLHFFMVYGFCNWITYASQTVAVFLNNV